MRKFILGFTLVMLCICLVQKQVSGLPTNIRADVYAGTVIEMDTVYAQGDISDTLLISQLLIRSITGTPVEVGEVIATIEITNPVGNVGIALEGANTIAGIWFNLRHKGLETVTAADTLVYRFQGVESLAGMRLYFHTGTTAIVVAKLKFGN